MGDKPEADVLWWDVDSFYVLCPHCEKVHHHSMNREGPQFQVPHCGHPESYLCCFPIKKQRQVAYEIDKRRARFVNICVALGTDADEVDSLAEEISAKARVTVDKEVERGAAERETDPNVYDDSKEMITIDLGEGLEPLEQKWILSALSDCVIGKTEAVRKFLETSVDAQVFLHGRDRDGNTTLINAAMEESSSMVSLLLRHGANVDVVNTKGRSALMEAALWGRVNHIQLLLEHGADKKLRDNENCLAVDLARPTPQNRRERYTRAGGDVSPFSSQKPVYQEDTFKRDIDRQNIVRLLGGEDRKSKIIYGSPPTVSRLEDYSFKRSPMGDSIVLRGPIANYPVPTVRKTVARLERGGKFASVAAMSGWSHDQWQPIRVSGRQWTEEVFYISLLVGHSLSRNDKLDKCRPGQYSACHAEKQLIAYFIDRHVFLPRDKVPDLELEAEIKSVENRQFEAYFGSGMGHELLSLRRQLQDLQSELCDADDTLLGDKRDKNKIKKLDSEIKLVEKRLEQLPASLEVQQIMALDSQLDALNQQKARHEALVGLSNAQPLISLTEAVILISSPICEDCMKFKDKVNQSFGLSIQLFAAC